MSTLVTGYTPRPLQFWLGKNMRRFNVIVCHRRFGKTVFRLNDKIDRLWRVQYRNPQGFYVAPTYGAAKRIAWEYAKDFYRLVPGYAPNEQDLRIDMTRTGPSGDNDRCRVQLLGAENPGNLKGIYTDDVTFDEFAEMDPQVWSTVFRPSLSDRMGGATFIGTPKGMNHFYKIHKYAKEQMEAGHPDWFTCVFKASETNVISKAELDDARAIMSEEEYDQEYECSFQAALTGAYYGKEISWLEANKRITGVPFDSASPVLTAWDLGMDDTTVIWFVQRIGREVHLIDYVEDSGRGLEHYAATLRQRQVQFGYQYEEHLFPHDMAARELTSGRSREETWRALKVPGRVTIVPKQSVEDGINASRVLLKTCWFDQTKTSRGLDALKNYQRVWDGKNAIWSSKPLHNWASNGADAFRQLALGFKRESLNDRLSGLPTETDSSYDIFGDNRSYGTNVYGASGELLRRGTRIREY